MDRQPGVAADPSPAREDAALAGKEPAGHTIETMSARLLLGNHAIARGAYEAGAAVAAGYPGTPSTEILEALAGWRDVYVEWATNEKVALDVALGAALGGARALATMKHVGLNVAADTLMTAAYTGVGAGLVIVSAADPGLEASRRRSLGATRGDGASSDIPVASCRCWPRSVRRPAPTGSCAPRTRARRAASWKGTRSFACRGYTPRRPSTAHPNAGQHERAPDRSRAKRGRIP